MYSAAPPKTAHLRTAHAQNTVWLLPPTSETARRRHARAPPIHIGHCDSPYDRTQALLAAKPPRASIKMPSNIPVAPKSQYEIERDERIKRNEAFMLSIGIDPHGGGYVLSSA